MRSSRLHDFWEYSHHVFNVITALWSAIWWNLTCIRLSSLLNNWLKTMSKYSCTRSWEVCVYMYIWSRVQTRSVCTSVCHIWGCRVPSYYCFCTLLWCLKTLWLVSILHNYGMRFSYSTYSPWLQMYSCLQNCPVCPNFDISAQFW